MLHVLFNVYSSTAVWWSSVMSPSRPRWTTSCPWSLCTDSPSAIDWSRRTWTQGALVHPSMLVLPPHRLRLQAATRHLLPVTVWLLLPLTCWQVPLPPPSCTCSRWCRGTPTGPLCAALRRPLLHTRPSRLALPPLSTLSTLSTLWLPLPPPPARTATLSRQT